jgi:hypothetical protein
MNRQMNKGNTGCASELLFLRIVPGLMPVTFLSENNLIVSCDCPNPPSTCHTIITKIRSFLSEGITGIDYRG